MEVIEQTILSILFKKKVKPDTHIFHKISSGYSAGFIYDFKWYGGILRFSVNTNTNFVILHQLLRKVYNDK